MHPLTQAEKVGFLKLCPLFQGLSNRQLSQVAGRTYQETVAPGNAIVKQGSMGQGFFVVIDGVVRFEKSGKLLTTRSQGAYFGEISLLDGRSRTASVIANTEVQLLCVTKVAFKQLLDGVPGMKDKIILSLCRYLRIAEESLSGSGKPPFEGTDRQ